MLLFLVLSDIEYRYMSDESDLIERARRDPEAFATLYRQFLPLVYRYLFNRLDNLHDAEDLTAQVFVEALDGLRKNSYKKGGNFRAWIFTIARRRAVDFYRKPTPLPLSEDLPSLNTALGLSIEDRDDLHALRRALDRLNDEKRELLRLRFSAELSFAEIAALEGKTEAAVKMTIYRALDALRQTWEAENE